MPGSPIAVDEIVNRVLALGGIGPTLDELLSA
jgi:hypothetical protein